jgi:ankyrin repeat protein
MTLIGEGDVEAVKQHLATGAGVNDKGSCMGSPLVEAILYGRTEAVELLIRKGADVNAKDKYGRTPLYEAATVLKEIVELLIAKGADVNVMDNQFGWTPLHRSSRQGRKEIVELLIASGADVNAKSENGETPLDEALQRKKTETAEFLRKHGGKTGGELNTGVLFPMLLYCQRALGSKG